MPLPKIDQPLFDAIIPSTGEKIMFRPFLVKEEKILLIAQSSNDETSVLKAIKQILGNCIQSNINIDALATFDIEYLFLKLRAKSVNNIAKLSYRDNEDEELYNFEVDLDKVEVKMPENINKKIKITNDIGMTMRYPSASITDKIGSYTSEVELLTFFVRNCIDTIYDAEDVYIADEYSDEDLNEFLDSLDVKTFEKIKEFFEAMPKLEYVLEYKNKNGNDRKIVLNSIRDFFM